MSRWTKRLIIAAIVAAGGYVAYDSYRAGYFTRPDMPDGAFSLSYKNGMRAILVGVSNEKETRRYLGFPAQVPFYLEEAWSFCSPPDVKEGEVVSAFLKGRGQGEEWPGERIEAICKIKVDNQDVIRGIVTSVPKL